MDRRVVGTGPAGTSWRWAMMSRGTASRARERYGETFLAVIAAAAG
jgi:hypothetical protein